MVERANSKPGFYEIKVQGQVEASRFNESEPMTFTHLPNGQTLISGPVADQAALFGLLIRIRDMALPLVSVNRVNDKE